MAGIVPDITRAFGDTPLVRLNALAEGVQAEVVAKLTGTPILVLATTSATTHASQKDPEVVRAATCGGGVVTRSTSRANRPGTRGRQQACVPSAR